MVGRDPRERSVAPRLSREARAAVGRRRHHHFGSAPRDDTAPQQAAAPTTEAAADAHGRNRARASARGGDQTGREGPEGRADRGDPRAARGRCSGWQSSHLGRRPCASAASTDAEADAGAPWAVDQQHAGGQSSADAWNAIGRRTSKRTAACPGSGRGFYAGDEAACFARHHTAAFARGRAGVHDAAAISGSRSADAATAHHRFASSARDASAGAASRAESSEHRPSVESSEHCALRNIAAAPRSATGAGGGGSRREGEQDATASNHAGCRAAPGAAGSSADVHGASAAFACGPA